MYGGVGGAVSNGGAYPIMWLCFVCNGPNRSITRIELEQRSTPDSTNEKDKSNECTKTTKDAYTTQDVSRDYQS